MQDMSYYAETDISFFDIEKCAQSLGYRCQQYDWNGHHLNVFFRICTKRKDIADGISLKV